MVCCGKIYLEALELANRSPCDPKTLTRAARDMAETEPLFAIEADTWVEPASVNTKGIVFQI